MNNNNNQMQPLTGVRKMLYNVFIIINVCIFFYGMYNFLKSMIISSTVTPKTTGENLEDNDIDEIEEA